MGLASAEGTGSTRTAMKNLGTLSTCGQATLNHAAGTRIYWRPDGVVNYKYPEQDVAVVVED